MRLNITQRPFTISCISLMDRKACDPSRIVRPLPTAARGELKKVGRAVVACRASSSRSRP